MRFYRLCSLFSLLVLLISACSQAASPSLVTPPVKPQSGKTTMIGRVLDKETGQPLAGRVLRLGIVQRKEGGGEDEGIFVMDASFSPGARSDENGYFIFENIDAKEYVLLLELIVEAFYTAAKDDKGKPLRWLPEAGKVLDLGSIYIDTKLPE